MSEVIIAFVGMPGAGKGTCVDFFTKHGVPNVYFGGMVYEEVAARGLDPVKDEIFVRNDMRAKEGLAVFAKRAAAKAEKMVAEGQKVIVFDGLYSWAEYEYLHEKFGPKLHVCAIITDRALRHQRILARQDGRKYTEEQIKKREIDEIEKLQKGGPIAIADHYLLNNGSFEELDAQLKALQTKLTS